MTMTARPAAHPGADWFLDARFGLFLHWGLYAVPAGEWHDRRMEYIGEWIMSRFRIPVAEYERLAERFNPQAFDADAWARLARRAGMRYVVLTAKHHEGFALYHSACDRYNIVDATPFGRDPLRELADACRRHGLKLGLYYSQDLDWHDPDGGDPGPAYPSNFGMSWGNDWDFPDRAAKNFAAYFERKVKPQVRELLTRYGPIGLIWFDCPVSLSRAQSEELFSLVRALQPDCLVNTRIGNGLGDYGSLGDNETPAGRVAGTWETPATLNDTWGYKHFDHNWKTAPDTLSILAGLASRNVNYLLNVGPQPDGAFPPGAVRVLDDLGDWMQANGEAIHGTRGSPFPYDMDWGWITRRDAGAGRPARLYLMLRRRPAGVLRLNGLRAVVSSARVLGLGLPGAPVAFDQEIGTERASLALTLPEAPSSIPAPIVVALDLEGDAVVDPRLIAQQDGVIVLPASCAGIHARSAAPPALSPAGILTGWRDERDWVDWPMQIDDPGEYAVEVITSAVHHSRPWSGGHTMRVEAAGGAVQSDLAGDELDGRPETRYYAQALSRLGTLRFDGAGQQALALKAVRIQPGDGTGVGVALVAVKLRRLPA